MPQISELNSKMGWISNLYKCSIVLKSVMPREIILICSCWRDLSALLNVSVMLSLRLHLQLSQHPKYLNFSTTSSGLEFMDHWGRIWFGCCPNTRILVLSVLIMRLRLEQYRYKESIRFCNLSGSSVNRTMSSAKRRQEVGNVEFNRLLGEVMCLGRSFMNREKSSGLRLHPCLTPLFVGKTFDLPWGLCTQAVDLE